MRGHRLSALWEMYLELALPLICVGGATLIPYTLRFPLICLTGLLFLAVMALDRRMLYFHAPNAAMLLFVCYLAVQLFYSYDRAATGRLFVIYACAASLLFLDVGENCMHRILRNIHFICTVMAVSIILSSLVDNCMLTYFPWVVNPNNDPSVTQAIRQELAESAYSGFARERSEAALIMNVGVAIGYARYFAHGRLRLRDALSLLMCLIALMLTGKRMMFFIAVANFVCLTLIVKVRGKVFRLVGTGMLALFALGIIFVFVPPLGNVLYRFLDADNLATMGNRNALWKYLSMMLAEYWLFGAGYGAYNAYAFDQGLRVFKAKWMYHGHNAYYQGLCEVGVVGSMPYLMFLVSSLFTAIRFVRKDAFPPQARELLYYACCILLMFMIYALTGNPAYTGQYVVQLFFAVGMVLCLGRAHLTDGRHLQ